MNTAIHAAVARDRAYMAEALALAANGLYDTKPNPAVGCVLVKNGRVIARGWTAPARASNVCRDRSIAISAACSRGLRISR